jgi:PAS domain S-box-containing protein
MHFSKSIHSPAQVPSSDTMSLSYQALVEMMPLGLEHCDLTGRISYSNAAHHRILGYPLGQLVGRYIWDFAATEESGEQLRQYLPYLIEHQPPPQPYFAKNRRADGEIVDVRIDWTYDRDPDGRLVGFVASIADVTELSQAQAKLQESESKYTDLYEHAPDMMCSVDAATATIIQCNETLANGLRYSKCEIIGKSLFQLYHSEYQIKAHQSFQLCGAGGMESGSELKLVRSDGVPVDVSLSVSTVRAPSGEIVEVRMIWRDITRRKRAEQALKDSEANLAAAQRIARLGSWELDLADGEDLVTNKLRWSDEVFRIFGYEPGGCEVSNQMFFDAVHPEDRDRITGELQKCLSDHSPYKLEHRIVLPDGTQRIVCEEGHIIEDSKTGAPLKMLGIVQDITDRRKNEDALEESHARLKRVLDSIIAYVGLLTPEGVIVEANLAPLESAGLSREEVIGRALVDTPWFAHSEQERNALRETIKQVALGKTIRRDFSVQMGEGNITTVDAVFSPLRGLNGEVIEIVISSIDVTQRRQAENDLHRLNAELEQRVAQRTAALHDRNQELESFAHSVSHDLRAPLRAMEGFATALKEDYGDALGDEGGEFVEHIICAARRMDALTSDLLAYSRLGRKEIRWEPVGLDLVLSDAVAALEQEIHDCNARLDIPSELPVVCGHATMLVQSITNLISNAMKFVDANTTPHIRVRTERLPEQRVRIWIEDNGIGISKANQSRIFNVFERLHGVESYPGTGIGLAIVRRACERLGGACGVESDLGSGSRFWFELAEGQIEGAACP